MGWRYLLFMLGGITLIMWFLRLFLFDLVESPRYLIGKGKDEEAVAVIHKIAAYNSTTSSLMLEHLTTIGSTVDVGAHGKDILSRTSSFTKDHIKALFATKRMAYSTSLLIFIWGKSICYPHFTTTEVSEISTRHHWFGINSL
jgi:Sugar (and other) transporter